MGIRLNILVQLRPCYQLWNGIHAVSEGFGRKRSQNYWGFIRFRGSIGESVRFNHALLALVIALAGILESTSVANDNNLSRLRLGAGTVRIGGNGRVKESIMGTLIFRETKGLRLLLITLFSPSGRLPC